MEANFHTALDVKYAILDEALVQPPINQVYTAAVTYGTTYNSINLTFPDKKKEETKKKKKI